MAVAFTRYDVIVTGLGAMGSATAYHLALRGKKVLGLDRWVPGHRYGSSHGDSGIIREMYFEHPMYVPLLGRAYDLWADLAKRADEKLIHVHGGLMIGRENGMLVTGTLRSARQHRLAHSVLSAGDVKRKYPAFELGDDLVAVLDPRAGWLDPERCNAAHLKLATQKGADLRFEEPVVSWTADDYGVSVATSRATYLAESLVLCAGARTRELVPDLELNLEVERQAVFWMEPPDADRYARERFPIWAYEYKPGHICYGFPNLPRGVKASIMHSGEIVEDADSVNRRVSDDEADALKHAIAPVLPELSRAKVQERDVCLFTNTPDHDFVIDFHPDYRRVLISSACSGHGFKFSSVIGEIQAGLIIDGRSRFDLSPFSVSRPSLRRKF